MLNRGVPRCLVPRPSAAHDEGGLTLVELMVTMSIAGLLAAVGMFGFWTWRDMSQHQGSAQELVSQLRAASERAISEGRTYCVDLHDDGRSYSVWQKECGGTAGTKIAGPLRVQGNKVSLSATLTSPSPAPACSAGHDCVYFYPRGTAVPGEVVVSSSARSKTIKVHVEGLTSRVWM